MRNLFIIALALLALPLSAQRTKMLTGDKSNEYGIVYTLPSTRLAIDMQATFTERVPGPYRQYAPRYLGQVDVIEDNSRSVSLDKVSVHTYGVAGDRKYLMTLKPGATTAVCVADDGMLLSVNTEAEAPELPVLMSPAKPARPDMDEYLQFVDEDFLVSLSPAKKAQMLARTIMDIRNSRLALSRGTAETMPTDGRQLELMLQSLEQQENALMRAFTGYEYSYTECRRVLVNPDSTLLEGPRRVIARLAPGENFAESDDLVGAPIYLTVSDVVSPEMPLNEKGEPKLMPKDAVYILCPQPPL